MGKAVIIKKFIVGGFLGFLTACGSPSPFGPQAFSALPQAYGPPQAYGFAAQNLYSQPGSAYDNSFFASTESYPAQNSTIPFDQNNETQTYSTSTPHLPLPSDIPSGSNPSSQNFASPPTTATPLPTASAVPIPVQLKDSTGELKILTLNVWGLPGPLVKDRKARFQRLGQTLQGYDIVTLQETFSNDIEILRQSTRFPYHLRWNNSGLRLGSGLYVLSKYPILRHEFRLFGNCTVADCLARKGVLFTRIDHPSLGAVDIYTTHYQAENIPVAEKIRIEENNRVMQEFIAQNNSPYPTILTGDFNFWPDYPEYQDLNRRLPLIDVWRSLYPDQPGYTSDPANPYKKGQSQAERLDYIFVLKQNTYQTTLLNAQITHNQPVEGYFLSDHFGVSAHLRFETRYSTELRNHPNQK